jgi:hypothetical protein
MMLAKLGLRAVDVATPILDDVDWRSGEMLVCAKRRQRARTPDVGAALVAYLRDGRPKPTSRPDSSPRSWVAYSNVNRRSYLLHDAIGTDSVGTSLQQANRVCTVRALCLVAHPFPR